MKNYYLTLMVVLLTDTCWIRRNKYPDITSSPTATSPEPTEPETTPDDTKEPTYEPIDINMDTGPTSMGMVKIMEDNQVGNKNNYNFTIVV